MSHKGPEGEYRHNYTLSLSSALNVGEWSMQRPSHSTPVKNPVPIVYVTGWAPGPVWTGAENLGPTGIRSLDCPAYSESLYQLCYPSPQQTQP